MCVCRRGCSRARLCAFMRVLQVLRKTLNDGYDAFVYIISRI